MEPHLLGACALSSANVLRAYVLGDKPHWKNFRFHDMRKFQVIDTIFIPRKEAEWHTFKISRVDTSPTSPQR